jgi:ferritin-like metal-binding protein YciE
MKTDDTAPEGNQAEDEDQDMDTDLHELFLDELADILNAEQQLTKALPTMAEAAESPELREAFESHLEETRQQISRLEQVFQSLGEPVKSKTCKAMKGLLEEGDELMEELENSSALDAGLIAAAQKVEHYEIATYGTLCAWAEKMGHEDAFQLLQETLAEEKEADEKLTEIAIGVANEEGEEEEASGSKE